MYFGLDLIFIVRRLDGSKSIRLVRDAGLALAEEEAWYNLAAGSI